MIKVVWAMRTKQDYYEVLGVRRDATSEEIKHAFRRLAFQFHPDQSHEDGAEEKFKQINEAYQVLSNPEQRTKYDRLGRLGVDGLEPSFDDFVGGWGDIFEAFFGGISTASWRVPQRGTDLFTKLTISFEQAVFGCEKEIDIIRIEYCSLCHGQGTELGSRPIRCPNCNGSGRLRRKYQSLFGHFSNTSICERCHGEGVIITRPCPQCQGTGRETRRRKVIVNVPAGVEDGTRICLSGEGNAGVWGGAPGSLYIELQVLEHKFFKREGNDILYELLINFAQAALGDEVEVPTVRGKVICHIPCGTQTGESFRLKGEGVPYLHHPRCGDQLVKIRVVTPQNLNQEQRRLLRELAQSLPKAIPLQKDEGSLS
jgi:molecular chaperone DnaJ